MTFFYSAVALSAFLISLLGTRLMILALRKRTVLLDIPNLRSNHRAPVPKGGGIAVVISLIICLLVVDIDYGIVLSLLLLAAVSLLDDLIGVPIVIRLCVQIIAVTVALSGMPDFVSASVLPNWVIHCFVGLLWVWFINVFNFMDGIDGISASEMISIGIGVAVPVVLLGDFPSVLSNYGLIVASAAFGFLWWNWHPAKIFLGDVGSVPIGFLLGYLLLLAFTHGYHFTAIILPAYYLSDASITLIKRAYRRQKIWQAHSEHYYQQAIRKGKSHEFVVRCIFGINLLLILLAVQATLTPELGLFHTATAYMIVWMLLGFFAHINFSQSHAH